MVRVLQGHVHSPYRVWRGGGGGGGGIVRGSCLYLLRGFFSAHNLQQGHDVGRAEEVCANDAILGLGLLANEVNVDGGGVTGQDAIGPTYPLQICNTPAPCCTVPSSIHSDTISSCSKGGLLFADLLTCDVTQGKGMQQQEKVWFCDAFGTYFCIVVQLVKVLVQ